MYTLAKPLPAILGGLEFADTPGEIAGEARRHMAILVPETLPDNASEGEKYVAGLLRGLPEDVLVYYEPVIRRRYPDFVLVVPEVGVLILEIKGIPLSWITHVDPHHFRYRQAGSEHEALHPARQAREYQNRLMASCSDHPDKDELYRNGYLQFAFGHLVILTAITRAELDASPWGHLFPAHAAICKDELEAMGASLPAWMAAFRNCINPDIPVRPMGEKQVARVRSILHPEACIPDLFANMEAPGARPDSLRLMDIEQERAARSMGGGHRIIYGVPGSGKTIILVARAKLLAQAGKSVLLLCFNAALQAYLSAQLAGQKHVRVERFGQWAMAQGAPVNKEDREQFGAGLLAIMQAGNGEAGTYDAVLIDEGQDFQPSWFRCAVLALKEPARGDLVICYDENQNLYDAARPVWSALGIHAKGRTRRLKRNYRNTKEIAAIAHSFCAARPEQGEDEPVSVPLMPENCGRSGPWPRILRLPSRDAQIQRCLSLIADMLRGALRVDGKTLNATASEILVLTYSNQLKNLLAQHLAEGFCGVGVSTIHGARGLQRRIVILLSADDLDSREHRNLAYVALTRPEELLVVLYSHDTPIIREMLTNIEAAQSI